MKRFFQRVLGRKSEPLCTRRTKEARPKRFVLETLEERQLLSGNCSIDLDAYRELTITGSASADTVTVSTGTQVAVSMKCGSLSLLRSFNPNDVAHITFWGGAGNDRFTNNTAIDSDAFGDAGKDTLTGGSGSDYLWGGFGLGDDDLLYGKGGNDELSGGEGKDKLYGGTEDDYLYGDEGTDTLYGENGNDYLEGGWTAEVDSLYGGAGNDTAHGGSGNDKLYGGIGNDKLYGNDGLDSLYGEAGSDFLDTGSFGEYVSKGTDTDVDYNAWVWAVAGATSADIFQGNSPTCWLVSSISAVAQTGVDLASRISYLGNNTYSVLVYDSPSGNFNPDNGAWTTVYVYFDGSTTPVDAIANPAQEGESWVIITQRAYLQVRGVSITNPPSGWGEGPLAAFTGRLATTYDRSGAEFASADLNRLSSALATGQAVVADTADAPNLLTTDMLVPWHQYTVVRVDSTSGGTFITLRNPWGNDGGATASGAANDGFVQISWSDFSRSMDAYIIA